jgi:hypothetical protein
VQTRVLIQRNQTTSFARGARRTTFVPLFRVLRQIHGRNGIADGAKNQKVGLQSRDRRSIVFYRNVALASACNDKSAWHRIWARNMDDTPEQLWQRIVRENPRASDEDVQCLFIAALIDDEDLRLQLLERFLKDMRKKLLN